MASSDRASAPVALIARARANVHPIKKAKLCFKFLATDNKEFLCGQPYTTSFHDMMIDGAADYNNNLCTATPSQAKPLITV